MADTDQLAAEMHAFYPLGLDDAALASVAPAAYGPTSQRSGVVTWPNRTDSDSTRENRDPPNKF